MNEKVFINNQFGRICGLFSRDYSPEDSVVLLVHGFNSHKLGNALEPINDALVELELLTFRVDLYAHGESSGSFETLTVTKAVETVIDSINYLKTAGFKKIGLIGSSFGGLASLFAAIKVDDLSFLILRSAVSSNQGNIIAKSFNLNLNYWKENGFVEFESKGVKKLNYNFYEDAQKYDALKIAPRINFPTFVIHGKADSTVPAEQSIQLSQHIKNSKLFVINNADHSFNDEQNKLMIQEIILFLGGIGFSSVKK